MRLVPLLGCVVLLPLARAGGQAAVASDSAHTLPPAMRQVTGEWDWSGDSLTCRRNPHTIAFTADTAFMVLRFRRKIDSTSKQEFRYRILKYSDHTITGQIEGEQRRNASGKPVVWDLVVTGPHSYRWRQADGSPQAVTRAIVRCNGAVPLSEAQ